MIKYWILSNRNVIGWSLILAAKVTKLFSADAFEQIFSREPKENAAKTNQRRCLGIVHKHRR
jgi:hypothetical protein